MLKFFQEMSSFKNCLFYNQKSKAHDMLVEEEVPSEFWGEFDIKKKMTRMINRLSELFTDELSAFNTARRSGSVR